MIITIRKRKLEEKQFYGRFKRLSSNISHEKTWMWLRKGNLTRETGSLLKTAKQRHKNQSYLSENRQDARKQQMQVMW